MLLKPTAKANPRMETRGEDKSAISPALIGMSLRQDIPGGLPSGRARFRFSCHDHSGTEDPRCQQKCSELRTVPSSRVSKLDTSQDYSYMDEYAEHWEQYSRLTVDWEQIGNQGREQLGTDGSDILAVPPFQSS